jgi:pyruvate dehydrogenase E1 component beta subunit
MPDSAALEISYVDALNLAIDREMQRDDSVFLFGLDVDDFKGIQGSTVGLVEKYGADRVFTTPLSEDAMTGVAIGAAMAGQRPIHVHIRMDFLLLCMNQLVNMASKASYMYGGQFKVPMVVRAMIGKSWGQGAQHSQGLYSMFMNVPGLRVVAPSNPYDVVACMAAAVRDDNPVIFVEHRLLYGSKASFDQNEAVSEIGKSRTLVSGKDITLVGISNMVLECLRAQEILQDEGLECEVIDPIWLAPLDVDAIAESAARTGRLLVVDNGWVPCGAGAEIIAAVMERLPEGRAISASRMGFASSPCPTTPSLEDYFYPNPVTIAQKAHAMIKGAGTGWSPDPERAKLSYQVEFKGPF